MHPDEPIPPPDAADASATPTPARRSRKKVATAPDQSAPSAIETEAISLPPAAEQQVEPSPLPPAEAEAVAIDDVLSGRFDAEADGDAPGGGGVGRRSNQGQAVQEVCPGGRLPPHAEIARCRARSPWWPRPRPRKAAAAAPARAAFRQTHATAPPPAPDRHWRWPRAVKWLPAGWRARRCPAGSGGFPHRLQPPKRCRHCGPTR